MGQKVVILGSPAGPGPRPAGPADRPGRPARDPRGVQNDPFLGHFWDPQNDPFWAILAKTTKNDPIEYWVPDLGVPQKGPKKGSKRGHFGVPPGVPDHPKTWISR